MWESSQMQMCLMWKYISSTTEAQHYPGKALSKKCNSNLKNDLLTIETAEGVE